MLQFRQEGIYCIPGNFFIDPWQPVDFAVVTHGHADHARWGMKNYLCHHFTVPILKSRIGIDISVQGLSYHESIHINGVKVSLHPAGHIIGSAQIRMEYKGKVCVVSGDTKLKMMVYQPLSSLLSAMNLCPKALSDSLSIIGYRWSSKINTCKIGFYRIRQTVKHPFLLAIR